MGHIGSPYVSNPGNISWLFPQSKSQTLIMVTSRPLHDPFQEQPVYFTHTVDLLLSLWPGMFYVETCAGPISSSSSFCHTSPYSDAYPRNILCTCTCECVCARTHVCVHVLVSRSMHAFLLCSDASKLHRRHSFCPVSKCPLFLMVFLLDLVKSA